MKNPHPMKRYPLCLLLTANLASGQTVLFEDNFDVADNASFDASDITGRLSGSLASDMVLRAHRAQQQISNNQLLLVRGGQAAGVRFNRTDVPFAAGTRFDWAAGAAGTAITTTGGFTVNFDWTPDNNTDNQWIAWVVGTENGDTGGVIVNSAPIDYGILFRKNGGTQRFDNGSGLGDGIPFTTTPGGATTYAVSIEYSFADFNDGTTVTAVSTVDGTEVANDVFQWDSNLGSMHMEIATNTAGHLIDNLSISTLGNAGYLFGLSENSFVSGDPQGTVIGDLNASNGGNPDPSTFTLVAGEGDTDNDKFQINGSQLEVGNFDFTGGNSTEGQQFSVRVQGSGSATLQRTLTLNLEKDDDLDNLQDDWEQRWAGNLTDLSATIGTEDFDSDGLTDAEEFANRTTYPDLDPTSDDTDSDNLTDSEEINPTGSRPATDPTSEDTDFDGLSDEVETNTGTLVDANDTGTNPIVCDTDGDYSVDGWEFDNNTNPFDATEFPGPAGPVAIVPITDAASSGIDSGKSYTHLVSGGAATTINGVSFEALLPEVQPLNLVWEANGNNLNAIAGNLGDWLPAQGGVDFEIETLLSTFTYSSNGAAPGNTQTFTLTGLNPGTNYDLRIYTRIWDTEGSGRPIELSFTNGTEVVQPFNALPQDRPGLLTGSGNLHDAYYLTYQYTAQGTEVVITTPTPLCGANTSGSFHMYALSNEVATGVPLGQILITNQVLLDDGRYAIGFKAKSQTTYQITKSSNLMGDFLPLNLPLSVTTDVNGDGQAIIPASETADAKGFYRIEE